MGLVATYHHPIVGNTTSFESKKWWQVADWLPGAMKKWGSLWSQNWWLEDDNFPFERCLLVTMLLSGRASFFSSRPKNCRKPFKEGGVVQKLCEICGVCGGANVAAHGFFSISLQKISLFFYRKRHLYKSTAANDILHKDKATLWHILLAPGGTEPWIQKKGWNSFVLENADRHGGLILKIPCKAPEWWF